MGPASGATLLLRPPSGIQCMHHNPSIPHDIHTLDRPLQKQGTRATVLRYHPQHPARFHSPRRKAMTGGGHKRHIYANSFRFAPRFLLDSLLIFMLPIIVIRSLISFSPHSFIDTPFMVTYTLIVATLYTRKWICITVWDTLTRIRVDNTERSASYHGFGDGGVSGRAVASAGHIHF